MLEILIIVVAIIITLIIEHKSNKEKKEILKELKKLKKETKELAEVAKNWDNLSESEQIALNDKLEELKDKLEILDVEADKYNCIFFLE